MADLQELSKLLTDAQAEVTTLDNRKVSLTQDIATYEARFKYLSQSIDVVEGKRAKNEQEYDKRIADKTVNLQLLQNQVVIADKDIKRLQGDKQHLESALSIMQEATDKQVVEFNKILSAKRIEIKTLETEVEEIQKVIAELPKELVRKKQELSNLDEQLVAKTNEVDVKLAVIDRDQAICIKHYEELVAQLGIRQAELETIDKNISIHKGELAATKKTHYDFVEYEKRARIALEARETAILDKEDELGMQLNRANRRNSVLDNLK